MRKERKQSCRSGGDSGARGFSLVSSPGCGERVCERLYTLAVSLRAECERHPGSSLKVVNSHPNCQRTGVSGVGRLCNPFVSYLLSFYMTLVACYYVRFSLRPTVCSLWRHKELKNSKCWQKQVLFLISHCEAFILKTGCGHTGNLPSLTHSSYLQLTCPEIGVLLRICLHCREI